MEVSGRRDLVFTVSSCRNNIEIAIADAGSGIDPAVRDLLWQPFREDKIARLEFGSADLSEDNRRSRGRPWIEDNLEEAAFLSSQRNLPTMIDFDQRVVLAAVQSNLGSAFSSGSPIAIP